MGGDLCPFHGSMITSVISTVHHEQWLPNFIKFFFRPPRPPHKGRPRRTGFSRCRFSFRAPWAHHCLSFYPGPVTWQAPSSTRRKPVLLVLRTACHLYTFHVYLMLHLHFSCTSYFTFVLLAYTYSYCLHLLLTLTVTVTLTAYTSGLHFSCTSPSPLPEQFQGC
jgi:hypothetical protein